MTDEEILALYFLREEQAITETANRYGSCCYTVANRILRSPEDSEECVNETWLRAWRTIPPSYPHNLKMYLTSITRNLAFNISRYRRADRRGGGEVDAVLDELSECLAAPGTPEEELIRRDLGRVINEFLDTLPERDRDVFLRRYYFVESPREIARRYRMREGNVAVILSRVRKKLKKQLLREGYIHDQ